MLVRLVPMFGGRPHRFGFKNVWLEAHTQIDVGWPYRGAQGRVESTGSQVMLSPLKGRPAPAANGGPVDGPTPLSNGDIIAFREDYGAEIAYEFEGDLRLAKVTRRLDEAGRGLHRSPPDTPSVEDQVKRGSYHLAVDEAGVTVTEKTRSKHFPWDALDAIGFEPQLQSHYIQSSGDAFREIGAGIKAGQQAAQEVDESRHRDVAASEIDPAFHAPSYRVGFMRHGKALEHFLLGRDSCELLAQAVEHFAPIDLTWFGELAPEVTLPCARAQPVSLERRARIESIVDRYASSIQDDRVFFRPAIPPDKLSNSLEHFSPETRPEAVLALFDDTWPRNGYHGILLTADCLHGLSPTKRPQGVSLDAIESVEIKAKNSRALVINGTVFRDFDYAKPESVRQLASILQEIMALRLAAETPAEATR